MASEGGPVFRAEKGKLKVAAGAIREDDQLGIRFLGGFLLDETLQERLKPNTGEHRGRREWDATRTAAGDALKGGGKNQIGGVP